MLLKIICVVFLIVGSANCWAEKDFEPEAKKYSNDLLQTAESGDSDAQYNLGRCYSFGYGVPKNTDEAFRWYTKSAIQGNSFAQGSLGACYARGLGIKKDDLQAFEWMKKAAEQNNPIAEYGLGVFYYNGSGVTKNEKEARKWLEKAADKGYQMALDTLKQLDQRPLKPFSGELLKKAESGDILAQFNIADCYFYGKGVPMDKSEGIRWLTKAADSGDAVSQYNLGIVFFKGLGVVKDEEKAMVLLQKAADQGNELAKNILATLSRVKR